MSLAQYSESRQPGLVEIENQITILSKQDMKSKNTYDNDLSSVLFLEIYAAADYYTTNKTLMEHVPPVFVDIILDPYIFNVFPRSLLPTAAYIILLAIGGWYLSKYISGWVLDLNNSSTNIEKKSA